MMKPSGHLHYEDAFEIQVVKIHRLTGEVTLRIRIGIESWKERKYKMNDVIHHDLTVYVNPS